MKPPFSCEKRQTPDAFCKVEYRIADANNDRVATCWNEANASEIVRRLNGEDTGLLKAAKELLALMDSVEIDSRLGDETDRVFPWYEFEDLRAAIAREESSAR